MRAPPAATSQAAGASTCWSSPGDADRIVLYEIYDDRAAFEAHLKTTHFARFNEASAALVADKKVTELDLVCEGSAA